MAISVDSEQSPQQQVTPPHPDSETLHRLAVEAAGYLDLDIGESLPISELVEQGLANDYTECEIRNLIEQEYGSTQTSIPVPAQEDIFGEIFEVEEETESNVGEVGNGTVAQFREWCEERAKNNKDHAYRRKSANRRFAKGKDVDRNFIRKYDRFSTILITYAQPQASDQSIADHADSFYPRKITRKRRRILKQQNVYDEAALLSVLAPKFDDEVPYANAPSTHAHDFIWIADKVSEECFKRLEEIEGFDVTVSIQRHVSSDVETPDDVLKRGSGMDQKRGDTTALPQELGNNIPLLSCAYDARGAASYIEKWSAHLRSGTDNSFKTNGIRRYRKLGTFEQRADAEKARRRIQSGYVDAQAVFSALECHIQSNHIFTGTDSNASESATIQSEPEPEPESESDESRFTFTRPDPEPEPEFEFSV